MAAPRSPPAEVLRRRLVVQHLYAWSYQEYQEYQETGERGADAWVLCCAALVLPRLLPASPGQGDAGSRWAHTIRPATLQALLDRAAVRARQAKLTRARKLRLDSPGGQPPIHQPPATSQPTAVGWVTACAC